MMADHTKGPWNYFVGNANGRGLIRIEVDGTGEHIASMPRGNKSEDRARLMTAAPDLLEALKKIVREDDTGPMTYEQGSDGRYRPVGGSKGPLSEIALAAIAKAEGRS